MALIIMLYMLESAVLAFLVNTICASYAKRSGGGYYINSPSYALRVDGDKNDVL